MTEIETIHRWATACRNARYAIECVGDARPDQVAGLMAIAIEGRESRCPDRLAAFVGGIVALENAPIPFGPSFVWGRA